MEMEDSHISLIDQFQKLEVDFSKKNEIEWEMGIDEAGRGPVMGPMVYGCTVWPISHKIQLSKLGFDDSKKLNEQTRDRLFDLIKNLENKILIYKVFLFEKYQVINLPAKFLSNSSLGITEINLNTVSHNAAMEMIKEVINEGFNLKVVYIDTVGPKEKYTEKLIQKFIHVKHDVKFIVSEKADSKYPVVSAASICAKVTRDTLLKQWKFEEKYNFGDNFGSGYPGDPKTVQWLKQNFIPIFGYPNLVRFSWGTTQKLLEAQNLSIKFAIENQSSQVGKRLVKTEKYFKIEYDNFIF